MRNLCNEVRWMIDWTRLRSREIREGKGVCRPGRGERRPSMRGVIKAGRPATAAACAVLLALTACTVGPNYVRPPAVTSASFKEMDGWKQAEPKDRVLRGKWWEIFQEPGLNALEEQVNISNQNVAQAEAQFRQAKALVQVARSAYFPTVSVGPSFTRSFQTTSPTVQPAPYSLLSLPVEATWEPDLWGRVRRSVESSRATAQATAADLEGALLSAQTQLAEDYFQLRALDAQKQILDATVEAYGKSLRLTRNRYEGGIASRADVLQADTQLKTTQAQAIDVGVQRAQLEHAIAILIGKAPAGLSLPQEPLEAPPPAIPMSLPSALLERRPDIAGAERRMASANAQIGVAIAAFYPNVTLSGAAGYQSTGLSNWLTWPNRLWSFGTSVSEVVYEGGLRRAQTEQARAAYDATVATYRQTVLTGFQEVEDNLAALRILEQEAAVEAAAVTAAEQSLAVITNQYESGIVAYLNVITAQTTVLSNRITALNILGRRLTAAVLLINALGGGWNASDLPAGDKLQTERQGPDGTKAVFPVIPQYYSRSPGGEG
ncbi:MAG: efflux transporter outer membrane subunit [Syntrophorhabdales bacterium]|jgi:NodT family efflux transporter outer membrane factor (OMF) lipoprotein